MDTLGCKFLTLAYPYSSIDPRSQMATCSSDLCTWNLRIYEYITWKPRIWWDYVEIGERTVGSKALLASVKIICFMFQRTHLFSV